jgi:small nuclear ribonucleoprotein (snRNP)-like protein
MLNVENKVVVRFRDGRMVKGYTHDFHPNREIFHVSEVREGGTVIDVSTNLLKAVFFVKTFEGNKDHRSGDDFSVESLKNVPGLKVKVTFSDGEVMYGSTHGYAPERKGFFIFPADKESNNDRVFIIVESTNEVETWR